MSIIKPIDNSIIQAAKEGNLAAFEQILYTYEKAIFNYIYRLTYHKQTAEDLTQDTFIKVYKNLKSVKTGGNFQSWLYKIATNTAYDWLRKKKRMNEVLFDTQEQEFETMTEEPAYLEVDKEFTGESVAKTLDKLKPVYKSVILMYYFHDLSYHDIAASLTVPINTVKTYLHRAKKAFKEHMTNNPT